MAGKSFAHGTSAEAQFHQRATEQGWVVKRGGWPDYAIATPETFRLVEVKSANDVLSDNQVELFEMLSSKGIDVFVWWELTPSRLIPWRRFLKLTDRIRKSHATAKAKTPPKVKPATEYWTKKQSVRLRSRHRR